MNKKNLILCFSSLRPINFPKDKLSEREANYNLSLKWLLKSLPNNWDIIYNDNSLSSLDELENPELKEQLKGLNIILHNNNHGEINKGAGEHDMCKKSFLSININDYNWVTYFTARHIIPISLYFDKLDSYFNTYNAVMSNPPFYYLNYKESKSADLLYNDMLFSMKSETFKKFVDTIDVNNLKVRHKSSEKHLYEFINENEINKFELDELGILRNDHQSFGWHLV